MLPARIIGQVLSAKPTLALPFDSIPTHAEQTALRDALLGVFQSHNPVRINGVRVEPELRSTTLLIKLPHDALESSGVAAEGITLHASDANVVRLVFGYPFPQAAQPARIDMTWDLEAAYSTTSPDARAEPRMPKVPVSFLHDGKWQRFSFSPEEPQHIWHAPRTLGPPPVPAPSSATAATIRVPMIAAAILGIGLVALIGLRGKRLLVLGLMAVGAAATWSLEPLDVALPWTTAETPDAPEAQAIFNGLHARIYRAFDQDSEPAIYDALAEAVDGPLLEWLYTRIYTDLVMREQGGAVAKAEGVDVQKFAVLPAEGAAFRVRATWQVTGTVTHWGHAHQRVNTYTAIYTIDRRDAAWKVVAVEPIEQQRSPPG